MIPKSPSVVATSATLIYCSDLSSMYCCITRNVESMINIHTTATRPFSLLCGRRLTEQTSIEQRANERGWRDLCQILSHCLDHTTTPDPQANWDADSTVQQYPQWRWSGCSKLIASTCSYRPDADEWTYSIAAKCQKRNRNFLVSFLLLLCQRCVHHTENAVSSVPEVIWFIPNTKLARETYLSSQRMNCWNTTKFLKSCWNNLQYRQFSWQAKIHND